MRKTQVLQVFLVLFCGFQVLLKFALSLFIQGWCDFTECAQKF
jgi:hypothetical protein